MPIRYVIHENSMPHDPEGHMAHVEPTYIADLDDIVDRIVGHGSTVARSDLYSSLADYEQAIVEFMREGIFVRTGLVNYHVGVRGLFRGTEDEFDPSRHEVIPQVIPTRRLRQAMQNHGGVVKQRSTRRRPSITHYVDVNSGTQDNTVTPGGSGRLTGYQLKFDPSDSQQGVFFVAQDGAETRVELPVRNMPREIIFVVPALGPGTYSLEVRVLFADAEGLRTGKLPESLTVR